MIRLYIIVFANSISVDQVKELFDKNPNTVFWFFSLPQSIFLKSSLSAIQLSDLMVDKFGNDRQFITEINQTNYAGMVPEDHIKYFKNV